MYFNSSQEIIDFYINILDIAKTNKEVCFIKSLLQELGYSRDSFYQYIKTYRDFVNNRKKPRFPNENLEDCKKILEDIEETVRQINEVFESRVVENAMRNKYNSTFAIFYLKNNAGWTDRQELEHSGSTTFNIMLPNKKKLIEEQ